MRRQGTTGIVVGYKMLLVLRACRCFVGSSVLRDPSKFSTLVSSKTKVSRVSKYIHIRTLAIEMTKFKSIRIIVIFFKDRSNDIAQSDLIFRMRVSSHVNSAFRQNSFRDSLPSREIPGIKCYSTDPRGTPVVRDSPL